MSLGRVSTRPQFADVVLATRMLGWSAILPVLKHVVPLRRLACLMRVEHKGQRRFERERTVTLLAERMYRFRPFARRDNCLERSLLAYRFLSMSGANPRLLIGVDRSVERPDGHAWVVLDGEPLYETRESIDRFFPLAEFPMPSDKS